MSTVSPRGPLGPPARRTKAGAALAALLMLAGLGTSACSQQSGADAGHGDRKADLKKETAAVHVDHRSALADRKVRIRIDGLRPHAHVTVGARATDQRGTPWGARGHYTADAHGVVDLTEQAPQGDHRPYDQPDSMGLLSSMLPRSGKEAKTVGSGRTLSFHPPSPARQRAYRVELTVRGPGGKPLADRTLTRKWLTHGVRHRKLTVGHDKVDGELYTPPAHGTTSHGKPQGKKEAPVLVFGGSEGGNAGEYAAALLAAHGHPALSLCYFRCGSGSGRPNGIDSIDLDYFSRAARILDKQPGADPGRLAVIGNSRGSEVAQLLGQRRPGLVHDVVAYAPSSKVNGPYLSGTVAWTDHGKPVPQGPIPLDHVRGTVLAIAGGNDKMWGSAESAKRIAAQHNAEGEPHRQVTYPGAGHHVNWFPYGQPGQDGGADGNVVSTSKADQAARAGGWPRVLKLLEE